MGKSILVKYIDVIMEKINLLKYYNEMINQKDLLFAYRGEARDYGRTRLMPSIFREEDYVLKERYLFDLLGDYNVIEDSKTRNIEKAIEAQHYVAISRMLDITFNILPALFFACSSNENFDKNGVFYVFAFPDHYSPHSQYIEDFYSQILEGKDIAYSKNFKVVSHSFFNERIKAQNGGFIFFQGKEFSPISEVYFETLEISADDKRKILEELNVLFGINEAAIYPEKEKRADFAKSKFVKKTFIKRELSLVDEINTYFERIQYECKMQKIKLGESFEKVAYLRKLRKEKEDLMSYIKENIQRNMSDKDIEYWEKYVKESFKMLELL